MPSWKEVFDASADDYTPDERLGVGIYTVEVTAVSQKETRAGNPRWLFTLSCPEGVAWKGVNVPYDGCKPGMHHFFVSDMEMLGITSAMLEADVDKALESAVGKRFRIAVTQRGEYADVELRSAVAAGVPLGREGAEVQESSPASSWEEPF